MSGFSSHGVGAGLCAKAEFVSAVSAAASKRVLVENPVILQSPSNRSEKIRRPVNVLNKSRTSLSRQYEEPIRRSARRLRVCDFPYPASRLSSPFGLEPVFTKSVTGMIRMTQVAK